MKPAPTLIDKLYRETFNKRPRIYGLRDPAKMLLLRKTFREARRFVLSDKMSSFMADLAMQAFIVPLKESQALSDARHRRRPTLGGDPFAPSKNPDYRCPRKLERALDQIRVSARLPHQTVWIEYDSRAHQRRVAELLQRPFPEGQVPLREGWLLTTAGGPLDGAPRVFSASIAVWMPDDNIGVLPFRYVWTTYDNEGAEPPNDNTARLCEIATGIPGFRTNQVRVYADGNDEDHDKVSEILYEWAGTIRRMWALLATINDLPVSYRRVEQTKGFIGAQSYRKFLDHSIITLNVPDERDLKKIARRAIALVRKRAHQVRGHWRKDWRKPGAIGCQHVFDGEGECKTCGGHRLWITEHQRGDASIGFVTHDYAVEHPQ